MCMQPENKSLVSVLMGVYYRREDTGLLRRSIDSILAQSYTQLELLICDDGSTEEAKQLIDDYVKKDRRVCPIRCGDKYTLSEKLNACLKEAKGQWIARMDDDDFSDVDRISVQMDYLKEHVQTAFVGCVARLEMDGKPKGLRQLPERPTIQDFLFVQPFLHPTLLFRRESLEQVGRYNEESRCIGCEDYDLLLRFYEVGLYGENIQKPFFTYTLPPLNSRKRTMPLRWNEVKTRYVRFKSLGLLPRSFLYMVKPVVVGLVPKNILERLKQIRHG